MKPEIRKIVTRSAPRGAAVFYRRFVDFSAILLHSTNDSHIYQSAKASDIYSFSGEPNHNPQSLSCSFGK